MKLCVGVAGFFDIHIKWNILEKCAEKEDTSEYKEILNWMTIIYSLTSVTSDPTTIVESFLPKKLSFTKKTMNTLPAQQLVKMPLRLSVDCPLGDAKNWPLIRLQLWFTGTRATTSLWLSRQSMGITAWLLGPSSTISGFFDFEKIQWLQWTRWISATSSITEKQMKQQEMITGSWLKIYSYVMSCILDWPLPLVLFKVNATNYWNKLYRLRIPTG